MIKQDCAILIVDKDPAAGALLAQQISDIPGMSVSACLTDGREAKEYLWTQPVDILITDIDLPGMNGLELVEHCVQQKLGCAMIIVSDVRDFDVAIRALQCGVLNYLPKPLHFSQLAESLEAARSGVRKSRLYLRAHTPGPYQALEQAICASFRDGASPEPWLGPLDALLTTPGQLLRITHQSPICETRSFAFATYRRILYALFPKTLVLSLYQEKNSILFLLVHPQGFLPRAADSIRAWFAHILSHPVIITMEGTIQSAVQLAEIAVGSGERSQAIEAACAYIQSHLSEPLTRGTVAKQVFLSPSYFGQLFKQTMGICFSDYVTQLRISHAKASLAQNIPIQDIAASAGFRNVKYFREIFYKETGYMPTDYRRALLTGTLKPEN